MGPWLKPSPANLPTNSTNRKTMTETAIHDAQSDRPYIQSGDNCLQIHSSTDLWSPDIFQLNDGRLCRVTSASAASMERLQYGVTIETAPYHSARTNTAHKACLGGAGTMYLGESGSWELYPQERLVDKYGGRNRTGHPSGIPCSMQANRRAAALQLILLSDELCRDYYDYVQPAQGLKVGRWRIKPLAIKPGDPCPTKPSPQSIAVRCHHQRHFLASLQDDHRPYTVRVIVEAWDYGNGVDLRGFAVPIAGDRLDDHPKVPQSVINACLSRCYAG
jgi:hypothetical protein